jgi:DNA-binding transcriptional LysR family regulator
VQHGVSAVFTQSRFERAGEIVDVRLRSHMRSSSPIVLHAWAVAGAGIALIPEWLVGDDGRLKRLLCGWLTPEIHAWALHRIEMRDAPRIRAVVDALATA